MVQIKQKSDMGSKPRTQEASGAMYIMCAVNYNHIDF